MGIIGRCSWPPIGGTAARAQRSILNGVSLGWRQKRDSGRELIVVAGVLQRLRVGLVLRAREIEGELKPINRLPVYEQASVQLVLAAQLLAGCLTDLPWIAVFPPECEACCEIVGQRPGDEAVECRVVKAGVTHGDCRLEGASGFGSNVIDGAAG